MIPCGTGNVSWTNQTGVAKEEQSRATLDRRSIFSSYPICNIALVEAAKHGFEDVITLQVAVSASSSPGMVGTDCHRSLVPQNVKIAIVRKYLEEHILRPVKTTASVASRWKRN